MYELRSEYQSPAHEATIKHCIEEYKSKTYSAAYHDQSVGAGKTIQIGFFAKHIVDKGGRCLVIARQGELVEQNAEDYTAIGGKPSIFSASLGMSSTYYPAVFATEGTFKNAINTAFRWDGEESTRKESKGFFTACLIDECHMVNWEDFIKCWNDFTKNGFDIYENKDAEGKTKHSQYAVIMCHLKRINPKIIFMGYSGSCFRDNKTIEGQFWQKRLSHVTTFQLIELGFLVPPVFGFADDEHHYQGLDKFKPSEDEGAEDYSGKELAAMGREICKQKDKTQIIIEEVIERTKDRLGVLITCASKKHCEQVAEYLPKGSCGIITDSTSTKERRRILKEAKELKVKYVLQIGCLTTGVNVPVWDVSVILRKIGSLTKLIQLTGRVLRTLKDYHLEQGLIKHDALVLDYTDTFKEMGSIFDDPVVQSAVVALDGFEKKKKTQDCPLCKTENSEFAVRCRGYADNEDGRCEHFFKSSMCFACQTENAPTAQNCRSCGAVMIDPNKALKNKAYSDADFKPVAAMRLEETKSKGGIAVIYNLASTYHKNGQEFPEVAKEYFNPFSEDRNDKARWWKFISDHIQGDRFRRIFVGKKSISAMLKIQSMLDKPLEITHRVNDKGFSIISRKRFLSGRESKAG